MSELNVLVFRCPYCNGQVYQNDKGIMICKTKRYDHFAKCRECSSLVKMEDVLVTKKAKARVKR